jgi:hypothetical protein
MIDANSGDALNITAPVSQTTPIPISLPRTQATSSRDDLGHRARDVIDRL